MTGLEYYRKKAELTQAELAQQLGVSQANISQWEKGESLPRADKLPAIASALNCSIDALYGYCKKEASGIRG